MTIQSEERIEDGPTRPAATLAEARALCVGERYPLFAGSFDLFDAAGFRPVFAWAPLVFGLLWFLYRRMYVESAVIFLIALVLAPLGAALSETASAGLPLMNLGLGLATALSAHWLYWKAVDRRLEQALRIFPKNPDSALKWLKAKGGTDPWSPALALGMMLFLAFSLVDLTVS